jgi:hypothetical protein
MSMIIIIHGVPREVPREIASVEGEALENWVKEQEALEPTEATPGEATTVTVPASARKRRGSAKEGSDS